MNTVFQWITIASVAVLLTSCNAVKVSSWAEPGAAGRPIGKTMVYGIGQDPDTSRQYEELFITHLFYQHVEAHSMHGMLKEPGKLDLAALEKLVQDNGFNSIIVTRILSQGEGSSIQGVNPTPSAYVSYWGDNSVAVGIVSATPNIETYQEVLLETNLYDVKTKKLIWSGRSKVYDDRSKMDILRGIVDAAVFDMKKKDLLKN